MNDASILKTLGTIGLIPIAVLDCAEHAVPLAQALSKGGIDTIEVTLRTDCALEGICRIKKQLPHFLVGVGTVLNIEQAEKAVKAGADYIVSPGFSVELVTWCKQRQVTVLPGCTTATEIQAAVGMGITTVKFFPASISGGAKACANIAAPFGMVKFIPTGGIGLENLSEYVKRDYIHAIDGGWLCSKSDIKAENWESITQTAKESVKKLLRFEVVHVGINTNSSEEAKKISYALADIFGFVVREGALSNFVGTGFEVNHFMGLGSKGHIAVDTNSVSQAEYHLGRLGVAFKEDSRVFAGGKTLAIYLQEEFGGFAIHLRQRQ